MRASAFASAASFLLAACTAPPQPQAGAGGTPRRVVSLNLCTDELLLLLAGPDQVASVTHLSHLPAETPLARMASRYPANDGKLANSMAAAPDLVLTQGGGGDPAGIAARIGVPLIDLPFPQTIDDVKASIGTVAQALGRGRAGEALIARIDALQASEPSATRETLWFGADGRTAAADGLTAQWMRLAGFEQRAEASEQVTMETLLVRPPEWLLRSSYRADQYSRSLARGKALLERGGRRLALVNTDGRRWTCMGPLLIDEILRLRRETA